MSQDKNIVVAGGGYAGCFMVPALEKALYHLPGYKIVFITGREFMFHVIGTFEGSSLCMIPLCLSHRNVSSAEIAERLCIPYDRFCKPESKVEIILKRAKTVEPHRIVLEDDTSIDFEFCIVATGKKWADPNDVGQTKIEALEQMRAHRDKIASSHQIVIVGGGGVGIETAGEIADMYPRETGKIISLIHRRDKLLNDAYCDKFRLGLEAQLRERGVQLYLSDALHGDYDFGGPCKEVNLISGTRLTEVDLIIRAVGSELNTQILKDLIPESIGSNGVKARPTFQLQEYDNIFVIGDIVDLPEQRAARKHLGHLKVVVENIKALANGQPTLRTYVPPREGIFIFIGSRGGMGTVDLPFFGPITLGPWMRLGGKEYFLRRMRAHLGYE